MMNAHTDKLQRLERENGVRITEHVSVSFKVDEEHGNPQKAADDFMKLVQSCLGEFSGFTLNEVGPVEGGAVKNQSAAEAKEDEKDDICPVCLDDFTKKTQLRSCKHEFCEECLEQSVKTQGAVCPVCKDVFGLVEGNQPHGTMTWVTRPSSLPGYEGCGTVEIIYDIPSGTQTAKHPSPGQRYTGLHRTAYLPNNREGNEVLHLLKRAFDQKLIFTVGTSRTTGANNMVTWNDIHHKTSTHGGPERFGYPDPYYLSRVKEELKAKGIK
uniref:E3 ubiquitin-protein ligase n=1 Tax=Periophthalmus magnuspinnatus TaxID=409849 RepID=A0A3B4A721_9GOBI